MRHGTAYTTRTSRVWVATLPPPGPPPNPPRPRPTLPCRPAIPTSLVRLDAPCVPCLAHRLLALAAWRCGAGAARPRLLWHLHRRSAARLPRHRGGPDLHGQHPGVVQVRRGGHEGPYSPPGHAPCAAAPPRGLICARVGGRGCSHVSAPPPPTPRAHAYMPKALSHGFYSVTTVRPAPGVHAAPPARHTRSWMPRPPWCPPAARAWWHWTTSRCAGRPAGRMWRGCLQCARAGVTSLC